MFLKVEQHMKAKQKELADHIERVESNTLGIDTTTAALKNRTEELAAKQDEILKQITMLVQSQTNPLGKIPEETPQGLDEAFIDIKA